MTDLITAEEAEKLLDECDGDDCLTCEYARTVIALHAQLADAQAAQAMVVERAAAKADRGHGTYCRARGRDPEKYVSAFYLMAREIRALAPIDGLALVRELRAESETRHQLHLEQVRITNEWIADRDRLAAANAVLEAKVAGLVEAIRDELKTRSAYAVGSGGVTTSREKFAAWSAASERLRALATQEAGTC